MSNSTQELVRQITRLHEDAVVRWHSEEIDNPFEGLLATVCRQHQLNFLLWHEEDSARSPDAGHERIAAVKRAIDHYNQQRNDWIEKIDEQLLRMLEDRRVAVKPDARLNTETPGSAIDRLSILSLRIYHLGEQLARADASESLRQSVRDKLVICRQQRTDLASSLGELLDDLFAGRKRLKVYRQLKMYNDPSLNPYLYRRGERRAG